MNLLQGRIVTCSVFLFHIILTHSFSILPCNTYFIDILSCFKCEILIVFLNKNAVIAKYKHISITTSYKYHMLNIK